MTDRQATPLDQLAERYFDATVELSPITLTYLGGSQRQDEYDDLSPTGLAAGHRLVEEALADLDALTPTDAVDAVTKSALRERLTLAAALHEAHLDLSTIRGIASGLHAIREVYDTMPRRTPEQWAVIADRLHAVSGAIDGWFASQRAGVEAGLQPAARQVRLLAGQCRGWVKAGGYFDTLANSAGAVDLPSTTRDRLTAGVAEAKRAYAAAAELLTADFLPLAREIDGVGVERYRLHSREFLGTEVDFAATYRWGLEEVARLEAEQVELCSRLRPGLSPKATKAALDDDAAYQLEGIDALRLWMQGKADAAVRSLHGTHFDIPEIAQTIECRISDTHDGGIWYEPPSEDFSRPGRMYWSVPEGVTRFGTWRELTTVYHEGVPGHHLQCAQALFVRDQLNRWRRSGLWVSGHGEGWALYAEALMAELGFLDDPAMRLGQLDGEAMRAARVVIDIGLHCGFTAPDEVGGGDWTWDKAWTYFNNHVQMEEGQARFEVLRYFGRPGQAPAYKIGQRTWLDLRAELRRRQGAAFQLKDFHARALNLGSVGLDTLREALLPASG
jgi:uncharacterized protein (DUF885 family)